MRSAETLDAVTVDGFGTLLHLDDPVEPLRAALARHGIVRDAATVAGAFLAEARFYRPRSLAGRDAEGLAALRRECVGVFLREADAPLEPAAFVEDFMAAISFSVAEGALEALDALAAAGLSLACVANWDVSLHDHLERLGLTGRFQAVVASADVGYEKPDPRIFAAALARLAVPAARALHVGDEEVDRQGAAAAGLAFEPAPLATLPRRLGLT